MSRSWLARLYVTRRAQQLRQGDQSTYQGSCVDTLNQGATCNHKTLVAVSERKLLGQGAAHANCPFSGCIGSSQPQTISHLFITCAVAGTGYAAFDKL